MIYSVNDEYGRIDFCDEYGLPHMSLFKEFSHYKEEIINVSYDDETIYHFRISNIIVFISNTLININPYLQECYDAVPEFKDIYDEAKYNPNNYDQPGVFGFTDHFNNVNVKNEFLRIINLIQLQKNLTKKVKTLISLNTISSIPSTLLNGNMHKIGTYLLGNNNTITQLNQKTKLRKEINELQAKITELDPQYEEYERERAERFGVTLPRSIVVSANGGYSKMKTRKVKKNYSKVLNRGVTHRCK